MTIINSVDEAFAFVKNKLEVAEKRANETFPKIAKLHEIKNAPITFVSASTAFTFDSYYSRNQAFTSVEQVDKKLTEYKEMLEANIKAIEETHALNIPLIESNNQLREKITLVMQTIGIPSTYSHSYFKTNRSQKKTTETKIAGYKEDLNRSVSVSDGFEMKIRAAKEKYEELARKANQEKQRIIQEQRDKEQEQKKKKGVQVLARLQVKYELDEDSDWSDVLEALDKQDKYFALARAIEDQRGNWSEGFGRAQYAVDAFHVETEEDKEIFESLHELAYSEDLCDGRSFRDTEWNYSVLYGKASEEVLADYETLQEYYSKY
ncbi:hypothetical protein D3C85_474670 [compost metagenome]